ncbi:hypothetical protein NUL63_004571 [Salmonella enterica]|nr:hypothetical protein [Salmonella enterica]
MSELQKAMKKLGDLSGDASSEAAQTVRPSGSLLPHITWPAWAVDEDDRKILFARAMSGQKGPELDAIRKQLSYRGLHE